MRAIDADAFEVISLSNVSDEFAAGARYVLEMIGAAPTIEIPQWTPASEPPQDIGRYCVVLRGKYLGIRCVSRAIYYDNHWREADRYVSGVLCEVTHWMPEPELPEEE